MIQTYSSTIRRKEMEAVLTCMVDEKIGPGELNERLIQTVKQLIGCDGAVALRSSSIALEYALNAINLPKENGIMLSALAPAWQIQTVEKLGYKPVVLDVVEETGQVTPAIVEQGIKDGGTLLILTETMGILPEIKSYLSFNIPIIEDISQSAMSYYPMDDAERAEAIKKMQPSQAQAESGDAKEEPKGKRAGMYGVYSIMGMEDRDIITSGGGAVLFAPSRREWIVLKHLVDEAPATDILPDMNCALANVELKEFERNEKVRLELYALYTRAIMSSRHKTFVRASDDCSTIYSFPLVLNSGFKDVKSYAQKKDIEVRPAFENSIMALRQEALSKNCICANSLLLRTALFPLYPRLNQKDAARIVKVLSSLP
ncbi:MAG: DegT/DnrJ/EryC1/StrS family aminotransferase [Treponema sp.]